MISEQDLVARFGAVRRLRDGEWMARCPAHDDRNPSLHVTYKPDRWLMKCHAGAECTFEEVCAAVGLDPRDLANGNGHHEIVAEYAYTDERGRPLYEVVRFAPKGFRQRLPDGTWGLGKTRRVLYRLPNVIAAVVAGKTIYIPEGEKDVHAIERTGAVATCNPMGAGKWRREYAMSLKGAEVIVIADRDEAGRKHARDVARSLHGVAKSVRVVEPAEGKDASDHLRAGRGLEDLQPIETPSPRPAAGRRLRNPEPVRARPVKWAWKERIPLGRLSLIVGNEGVGKGTVVAYTTARWSRGTLPGDLHGTPCNVLVVGDEDALDDTWTPRLYAAGADWRRVWFPPEDAAEIDFTSATEIERLRKWIRDHEANVVVFDALLDHLGGSGVDEFKAKSVRNALRPLRRIANEEGVAAVGLMHPRKGRALAFRDLIANSHQFNAVSRSSLLLAEHPDDKAWRVLVRAKGNLAGIVPTLEFRIAGHVFELNGHTFNEPYAVGWKESDLTTEDVLSARGGGGPGRPRDEDKRDAVEDALTDGPQSVRDIAKSTGVPKSTVQEILAELLEDGDALKTDAAWASGGVSGNESASNIRTPFSDSGNGSTKPNPVSGNGSGDGASEGVPEHPPQNASGGWKPHLPDEDAPDWWQS